MNSDEDLEALLGRLAPAPPSADLMARLQAACPPVRKARPVLHLWLPLAAAAGLTLAWLWPDPPSIPEPVAEKPDLQPVGSVQHLMEVADLGVVMGEDQRPVRLIRTRWVDEILYASPGGGEPVKEGRLREEVLPVSLDLY
ncbi:hypothetical protein OKA05_03975 [Luteolibacter arcticus]|uniref:DUF3379 domain-containing protein n=1 Tax=Luteolibacter arcticus TaxID=1581411 RepID=A0ABT3GDK7_9BACT|nr:hypothetical protein [Luteolibacter arcticus]MCW1921697.1 hypothetical protein [Luteolibacter arcticus]